MKIAFSGIVKTGDPYRCGQEDLSGALHIGGVDVVDAIDDAKFPGKVTVALLDERYEGGLSVDTGYGYSEYTPIDADELHVGPHDLIEILGRYEGKEVRLIIADEPVDLGEYL